jgi:hypothetical protein
MGACFRRLFRRFAVIGELTQGPGLSLVVPTCFSLALKQCYTAPPIFLAHPLKRTLVTEQWVACP